MFFLSIKTLVSLLLAIGSLKGQFVYRQIRSHVARLEASSRVVLIFMFLLYLRKSFVHWGGWELCKVAY